ncbi:uncharacterized protein LOC114526179 [Dendronephthya gigantea]|uniref:uncharacterized protein LOC114526179 n=1 Tax=Dendronephthya gigantea TaxID=151771 RepID=UPI00106AED48|nr:uncharacterized protein LOC114526179 [Dendronephthya gigantea]
MKILQPQPTLVNISIVQWCRTIRNSQKARLSKFHGKLFRLNPANDITGKTGLAESPDRKRELMQHVPPWQIHFGLDKQRGSMIQGSFGLDKERGSTTQGRFGLDKKRGSTIQGPFGRFGLDKKRGSMQGRFGLDKKRGSMQGRFGLAKKRFL